MIILITNFEYKNLEFRNLFHFKLPNIYLSIVLEIEPVQVPIHQKSQYMKGTLHMCKDRTLNVIAFKVLSPLHRQFLGYNGLYFWFSNIADKNS